MAYERQARPILLWSDGQCAFPDILAVVSLRYILYHGQLLKIRVPLNLFSRDLFSVNNPVLIRPCVADFPDAQRSGVVPPVHLSIFLFSLGVPDCRALICKKANDSAVSFAFKARDSLGSAFLQIKARQSGTPRLPSVGLCREDGLLQMGSASKSSSDYFQNRQAGAF